MRRFFLIFSALRAARVVQDFLWGPGRTRDQEWGTWMEVLEKRLPKLRQIDRRGKHWQVEARKRLIQIAAVSIAMIEWIDNGHGGE
jgi:hypothetical protein